MFVNHNNGALKRIMCVYVPLPERKRETSLAWFKYILMIKEVDVKGLPPDCFQTIIYEEILLLIGEINDD